VELKAMKKLSIETGLIKVSLSVTLLLSQSGVAVDFDSYSNAFKQDIGKAETAFSAVLGRQGATGDSLAEQMKSILDKNEKNLVQDKEELDQRDKLKSWVQKNDALKKLKGMPDVLMQKALSKRQLELDKADQLAAQLGETPVSNTSNFSTSNLPKACQKNVDFSQVRGLLDQMASEPGQYLKRTAQGMLKEKRTDLKQKQVQKLADVMRYFKELSQKDESVEALVNEGPKGDVSLEKRIAELKSKNKAQKELNKELKGDLVDVFSQFMGQLGEIKDNDKKVSQLGAEFTKMLQNIRRQAGQAVQDQTSQLLSNCQSEVRNLNNDIMMSNDWMVRWGVNAQVAQLDTQAQLQRAQEIQCQDVGDRVQAVLQGAAGTNINGRINSIAAAKDPATLMSEAVNAMQDVANMQTQLSQELQPLMQSCEDAANAREAVKQRIQPIVAQASNNSGNPRTGANSNRSSRAGGAQQPFGNLSSHVSNNPAAIQR
jgi:hypothetical protein